MTRWIALILMLTLMQESPAQQLSPADTIQQLPEAVIVSTSLRDGLPGSHQEVWNLRRLTGTTHRTLSDFLTEQGGVYVKNYGTGNTATTSIRGGSAGHTRVLWNGLPLEQPMLGQMDFSLLPLAFSDEVRIQYGGNSAGWGSGAVSGVVQVNNVPDFEDHSLHLNLEQGSFGSWQGNVSSGYGSQQWLGRTRIYWQQANNNFPYRIRPDLPSRTLEHAFTRQSGAYQEGHFQLKNQQLLSVHAWYQQADREIPPTTQQSTSEAKQQDQALRTAVHWTKWSSKMAWHARAGVYRESLNYDDPRASEFSDSHFWTILGEGTWQWHIDPSQRIETGITETWQQALANVYGKPKHQWRLSPFIGYRYRIRDFEAQGLLREELVDGRLIATTPSLALHWRPREIVQVYWQGARNYRLPTLNDLYWQPGGNPDLLPESGWGQELSLSLKNKNACLQWSSSVTAYTRQIRNWILWSPLPGQFIWSPQNLTRVWSRGLELRGKITRNHPHIRWTVEAGYDLVHSTNQVAQTKPLLPVGSQLVYVPRHQAFASFQGQWRNLEVQYRQHYTSQVSTLNAGELSGYSLGNLLLDYRLKTGSTQITSFLRVNNLWNVTYRSVEYRPMPGRNYALGIHLELNSKKIE